MMVTTLDDGHHHPLITRLHPTSGPHDPHCTVLGGPYMGHHDQDGEKVGQMSLLD